MIINGWSDKDGAIYVNQWYSEMRATAVAIYLEKRGVSSSRIFCYGKGVDKSAKTNDEARRADVLILLKCKK